MTAPRTVPDARPPLGCITFGLVLVGASIVGLVLGYLGAALVLGHRIGLR